MSSALRMGIRGMINVGDGSHIVLQVHSNLNDAARFIGDIGKEVRYASAVALTRTARRLVPLIEDEVRKSFDRPVPFTVKAFGTLPATKESQRSEVFIKDRQAKYLVTQIKGGARPQKRFERRIADDTGRDGFWVPGQGVRLNAAGNLTRRQIQDIAIRLRESGRFKEVFVGVPKGQPRAPFGIWGRVGGSRRSKAARIIPLLVKIAAPHYRQQFDFHGVARKHAQRIFNEEFTRAFEQAKRTVRPIDPSKLELMWARVL